MVFYVETFTGFKDKRSLLLFLKQFFRNVIEDENTSLSDALKILYYHLDKECQYFYVEFLEKRQDLGFVCVELAKIFSSGQEGIQKVVELVHCFNKIARKENNYFCFPFTSKKNIKIKENSVLFINTVPQAKQQRPPKNSATPNRKEVISLKAESVFKINELKKKAAKIYPSLPKSEPQDYSSIKKQLLKDIRNYGYDESRLFRDPEFPASDCSLYRKSHSEAGIEWLRPIDIVDDPHFFCDGYSRFDIVQGGLGDCWFLAALSNLTLHREAFLKVVDPNQSFTKDYAGIFHFKFWQYGEWVDVVIDDRLPTINGKLIYTKSSDKDEFWTALVEKAYAKLYGSYEALDGGLTPEALEDMTGGITEIINIKDPQQNLLQIIFRGVEMGSLFGCSFPELEGSSDKDEIPSCGLLAGHAYSITGIQIVKCRNGPIPLIRIRNPWGGGTEWTGAWSDGSKEWETVPPSTKQKLNFQIKNDGEFWMSFNDFKIYFEMLEVCHIDPNAMKKDYHQNYPTSESHNTWTAQTFHGAWRCGESAGGSSRKNVETYRLNPQYLITVDNAHHEDDLCTLVIGVLQKYRRELKKTDLAIKFLMFKVARNVDKKLGKNFFANTQPFFESKPAFAYLLRETTSRILVPPGKYIIVPSTQELNEEADFMLRIFTDGIVEAKELY